MNFFLKHQILNNSIASLLLSLVLVSCNALKAPLSNGESPWSADLQNKPSQKDPKVSNQKREPKSKKASPWGKEKNPELVKLQRQLKAEQKQQKRLKKQQQAKERQLREEQLAQKRIKSIEDKIAQLKAEQAALGYTEPEETTPSRQPKVTTQQVRSLPKSQENIVENDLFLESQSKPTPSLNQSVKERQSLFRKPNLTNQLPSEQQNKRTQSFKEAPIKEGITISGDSSQ